MGVPTMLGKIDTRSPRFWLVVAFGLICLTPSTKAPVSAKDAATPLTPCPVVKGQDVLAIDLGSMSENCALDLPSDSMRILIQLSPSKRHTSEAYPKGSR